MESVEPVLTEREHGGWLAVNPTRPRPTDRRRWFHGEKRKRTSPTPRTRGSGFGQLAASVQATLTPMMVEKQPRLVPGEPTQKTQPKGKDEHGRSTSR